MIISLGFLIVGLCVANAQENSMANIPKSLLECYNNTYLLDRNNKLPQNVQSLLAILRKIEDDPELNMDIRRLSVALLHRFRQDGIILNPRVEAQTGITPYAPNGVQFHRHAETLRLIPGNAVSFPNNSISSIERCSLHSMLSSSIDIMERSDKPTTCRNTNEPYRYPRNIRKRWATQPPIGDDVETLTADQLETMSNKDEAKDTGVDPNSWYPPLPPNHPDNARLYASPVPSKCPVENGVIKTNWGAVSAGPILAGIAAGLEPQNVRLGELLRAEWQSRAALSSTTLDNKWIATIGSDLAEVVLRQGPVTEEGKLNIGADGHWNSSYIPRWYFLNTNEDLFYTAAEIRGDLDGLILATEIAGWYSRYPNIKLSQILDMYYSDRGVFNTTIRACNRKALLTSVAPNSTTVEQTYRSALVLSPGVATVTIEPAMIEKFAVDATNKLFSFIPSMNDPTCRETTTASEFNRISTDITIFLDTNWPFVTIQPILAALLENLDISKYNSNFTLISAQNGTTMINSSNSILDFYIFNETQYSSFARGFDLSKSFDTIRSLETWKLNEEKHRGLGGKNSEVILIVPYTSSITDTDKEYCLEQLKKLREDVPDATIKFLTHGSKDRWSDLVGDPSNDIFSVGVLTTQDISGPVNQLLSSIKRVPRRLINSQCGATYTSSGPPNSYDDYLEPSGINFYRLHPNYFYTSDTENVPAIKVETTGSTRLTICTSREPLHINSTTTLTDCKSIDGGNYRITTSCGDASYIHDCNPLYMSVSANSSSNAASQCTDDRRCRYPDMVKYTVSYENLVCVNSASRLIVSPIILLLITVYSYM